MCTLWKLPTYFAIAVCVFGDTTLAPADIKDVYTQIGNSSATVTAEKAFEVPNIPNLFMALQTVKEGACKRDLGRFVRAISQQEKWAMSMFDASVKFPNGLIYGHMYQLGNYDECVSTQHEEISGQYCLADVAMENNTFAQMQNEETKRTRNTVNNTIHWAFCVPGSCEPAEVRTILQRFFLVVLNLEGAIVSGVSCSGSPDEPFNLLEIIYGSVIGVFVLFVLLASTYHGVHTYRKSNSSQYSLDRSRKGYSLSHELILAFSLIRNVSKVIETKSKNNDFNLDSITGLKTISMVFILAGHSLFFLVSSPTINSNFLEKEVVKVQNAVFLNNPLLVDSFLLISGFLMCRLLLLELEKRKGKVNFFVLYLARYIRLTPAYLAVIGFYATFFVRLGEGPLWSQRISKERDRCLESWWSNILYVNNYVKTDNLCMFQSWYLSVDTQLFVIAPFIVYPLWRRRVLGQWLLGFLTVGTAIVPLVFTYIYRLDPTLMIYAPEIKDLALNHYFINAYIKTHMRANAYIFGLLFGYIVHKTQTSGYKAPNYLRIVGWTFAAVCGSAALFSVTIFYLPQYEYSAVHAAIYSPLHRICWCVAVGWTIFVTVTYNDGFVNRFLSWKFWGPFSRLAYCGYLVNGIVELYSYGTQRVPKYMSIFNLGAETGAHIIMTFLAAFVLCVLFESPIHNIEKILLRRDASSKQQRKFPADG